MLVILLAYGLVAIFLVAGTTFSLRIVPTVVLGLVTLAVTLWWSRDRKFTAPDPERSTEWKILWIIIGAGIFLRVAWWAQIQPVPFSDCAVYLESAAHLVRFSEYRVPEMEGDLIAYRPPGTAFLLALIMKLTGNVPWAPLILNLLCFTGAVWLVWKTIRPKVPQRAALAAVGLLSVWPSDVMFASLPQSESPSLFGVALLMFLLTRRHGRLTAWAVTTSLTTGMLCLLRNSNLILIPLWILVAMRSPEPWQQRIRTAVIIIVVTLLPILPWTYRNFRQLGVPVLIATNGGENLYSANSDVATGSWEESSVKQVRVYLPDEVKMDRVATRMATEWIRSHPVGFVKLAVRKLRILMSSDDQGSYATLVRGIGYTGPWVLVAQIAANAWWLVLWCLVFTAILYRSVWQRDPDTSAILALAAIPGLLFLIFQSQPRYHMPMVPPLIMLAGYALSMKRQQPDPAA